MGYGPLGHVLRHVRRMALTGNAAQQEDRQLLERFLARRDEAAFEALLRRHGPMVLGICRRILADEHAAEDAFQATFLVLIRKGQAIRRAELLGNWLYGVACRTARKARTTAARQQVRERRAVSHEAADAMAEVVWNDLRPVLDEKLERLPAKYRRPVVLCYLQGKTLEEAAGHLGWPAGTVSGRLARARELLRRRLTRRGITLSAAMLATVLTEQASASLPGPLFLVTTKAAMALVAGQAAAAGVLSPSVATLLTGVLRAMMLNQIKIAAVLVLSLGVLCGAGALTYLRSEGQPPAPQANQAVAPPEKNVENKGDDVKIGLLTDEQIKERLDALQVSDKVKDLLKARVDAAHVELDARFQEFLAGRGMLVLLQESSRKVLDAERELSEKKVHQIGPLEAHFERMKKVQEMLQAWHDRGRISIQDLASAKYDRYQAELWLERAKSQVNPGPERSR